MSKKRPSKKILLMIFLIIILYTTGCSPNEKAFGVIFTANITGNQDIYRVSSSDFKLIERLTFTPTSQEKYLRVTKDGDRILFYVPKPDSERIKSELLTPPATYAHTYILDAKSKTITEINRNLMMLSTTIRK